MQAGSVFSGNRRARSRLLVYSGGFQGVAGHVRSKTVQQLRASQRGQQTEKGECLCCTPTNEDTSSTRAIRRWSLPTGASQRGRQLATAILAMQSWEKLGGAACSETWPRTRIIRTPPEYLTAISCLTWLTQHDFHQKTLDSRWIAASNERFAWDHCGHRLWTEKNLALLIASLLYLEVGLSAPNT